jgi:hypothetical protein
MWQGTKGTASYEAEKVFFFFFEIRNDFGDQR